jgi:hypothetical protein
MKIASRYRPFSHKPGSACLIPNTACEVIAYPAAVVVKDDTGKEFHIEWYLTGLIKEFTMMQDLERREVVIHGIAKEGHFSYILASKEDKIVLKLDRASQGFLKGILKASNEEICLKLKETVPLFNISEASHIENLEKISFGNHKAQDWDLIKRRNNPLEYIPFWFALGQGSGVGKDAIEKKGALLQLELCKDSLEKGEKELFLEKLSELFQAGFKEVLVPSLYDHQYLGLSALSSSVSSSKKPMELLKEGYELIRKMMFELKEGKIRILPHLPAMFHAGRCLNFQLDKATFHIEWSKKLLKKLIITCFEKQELSFSFQKPLKSYRLRASSRTKGIEISCSESIVLDKGIYILDQFKK